MSVRVYTDGACAPRNPGPGGWAAVIVGLHAEPLTVTGSEPHTTNNRMELLAVIEGLASLEPLSEVEVVSDSQYVVHGYTRWLPGWQTRGWRTKAKEPVANRDLWELLLEAVAIHGTVTWRWVRGHNGDAYNDLADELAEYAARQAPASPGGNSATREDQG